MDKSRKFYLDAAGFNLLKHTPSFGDISQVDKDLTRFWYIRTHDCEHYEMATAPSKDNFGRLVKIEEYSTTNRAGQPIVKLRVRLTEVGDEDEVFGILGMGAANNRNAFAILPDGGSGLMEVFPLPRGRAPAYTSTDISVGQYIILAADGKVSGTSTLSASQKAIGYAMESIDISALPHIPGTAAVPAVPAQGGNPAIPAIPATLSRPAPGGFFWMRFKKFTGPQTSLPITIATARTIESPRTGFCEDRIYSRSLMPGAFIPFRFGRSVEANSRIYVANSEHHIGYSRYLEMRSVGTPFVYYTTPSKHSRTWVYRDTSHNFIRLSSSARLTAGTSIELEFGGMNYEYSSLSNSCITIFDGPKANGTASLIIKRSPHLINDYTIDDHQYPAFTRDRYFVGQYIHIETNGDNVVGGPMGSAARISGYARITSITDHRLELDDLCPSLYPFVVRKGYVWVSLGGRNLRGVRERADFVDAGHFTRDDHPGLFFQGAPVAAGVYTVPAFSSTDAAKLVYSPTGAKSVFHTRGYTGPTTNPLSLLAPLSAAIPASRTEISLSFSRTETAPASDAVLEYAGIEFPVGSVLFMKGSTYAYLRSETVNFQNLGLRLHQYVYFTGLWNNLYSKPSHVGKGYLRIVKINPRYISFDLISQAPNLRSSVTPAATGGAPTMLNRFKVTMLFGPGIGKRKSITY